MLINNSEYFSVLDGIKKQIREAQYRAVLGVNREQIVLFWNIGKTIIKNKKYGNAFVENLARDIKAEFPNVKGFSVRNLRYMRKFAELFDEIANLQVPLADLTLVSPNFTYGQSTKYGSLSLVRGENFGTWVVA